jgi:ribulose-bisphosphate carboxylase large chain
MYVPNVTAGGSDTLDRARCARSTGAGGLLVTPGLAGLGTMASLAASDEVSMPIFSHPAFQGSYVTNPDAGISHAALFGQIARLAGADASIYPNFGGRFSFDKQECRDIASACVAPLGTLSAIFPMPGGGMTVHRVPELLEFYGNDVILLIGGGLFQHGPDLLENCREFRRRIGNSE